MQTETICSPPTHELVYPLSSILTRIELSALFTKPQPLEIELGSGDGSFLVNYAKTHRDTNFIGVERLLGRLRKTDKKGRQAGLTNLRLIRIESAYFLQYLLPQGSASALHVYFPDPWPKRKHRRHRLINESFITLAHAALMRSGKVFLRTDDADYFAQMRRVFDSSSLFSAVETPEDLAETRTDFEADFNAIGTPTLKAAYQAR